MPYEPNTELLAKYRIESLIGEGAFGEVYRALHLQLKVPRALKVLRRDAPGVGSSDFQRCRERFELEAQLGAQLEGHSSCIQAYDFEHDNETLILVMEYAPNGSLAERLETARRARTPLPVPEVLRWATEIAEGLAALHALDAVHRDLKPSNILFDAQGRAKLADFGLAQMSGGPSMRSRLSMPEPHPGTPAYMSPEQRETTDHLTPAADVYALGCVLFEALTGRVYRSQRPGTRVTALRSDVPDWVDALIARCLEKESEARPWDGAELLELLRNAGPEEVPHKQRGAKDRARQATARQAAARQAAARKAAARKEREAEEMARRVTVMDNQLTLQLAPDVKIDFVRIPAGEFLMGTDPKVDKSVFENEQPQRKVYLDGYWMGKYPVTVAQFRQFIIATKYKTQAERQGFGWHWSGGKWQKAAGINWTHLTGPRNQTKATHPVVQISWEDAAAFCAWVSKVTEREIRLPTEAEWEKVARGLDGRLYPWGNAAPDAQRCNFYMNVETTTPVGKYSPHGDSPYGCADMAGNVWEWCADWFDDSYYRAAPTRNPPGPQMGEYRVLRGGSWHNSERFVRNACRFRSTPTVMGDIYGFRCVITCLPGE